MNGMAMGKVSGVPMAEDAPPDLLAGGMDLRVVLPCGSVARCNVDRSTPMMDLLVQLAKVHRISPAAHTLQPFGMKNTPLQSQPSTPIGALDVFTVKIVPKARPLAPLSKRTAPRPTPAQPFEQTFRLQVSADDAEERRRRRVAVATGRSLGCADDDDADPLAPVAAPQVHLPRNQLYVTRASRATVLGDIRHLACTEKNLDPLKYELRHPANPDQRLDPDSTLGECGLTEVALVAAGGRLGLGLSQPLPDIMALRRQEDRRREAAKAGQFGYLTSHSMAEGSVSSASSGSLGGRSTSPAPSDGERSTSPPAIQPLQQLQPPSRPGRKRRPAPKPPVGAPPPVAAANNNTTTTEMNNNINKEVIASGGTVISHSRNSSDSSGYHEASVLSESPEGQHDGLQGLRQHQHQGGGGGGAKLQSCISQPNLNSLSLSRSMTNLSVQQQQLCVRGNRNSIAVTGQLDHDAHDGMGRVPGAYRASTSSLATAGQRKKKAPPPPPPAAPAAPKPRPAADGSSAPATPAAPAAPADPFLKTQSLERQTSVVESPDVAPQLRPGLTKSSTLPSSLSSATCPVAATADAFPPVGSLSSASATGSSSSCPTPTPSEQSVHLSDADSDLGTAEDLSPPRSDFHDDESSLEQNMQINDDKVDKESERDSPVEKCQTVVVSEEITELRDVTKESIEKLDCKQLESPSATSQSQGISEEEWEYRLPSPPSAFRDSRSHSPTVTDVDSVNLAETNISSSASLPGWEEKIENKSCEKKESVVLTRHDEPECDEVKTQPPSEAVPSDTSIDINMDHKKEEVSEPEVPTSSCSPANTPTNETVINTAQPVIHSMNVPNESKKNKLEGSAAVLDELNKVLSEQRSSILSTQQSVPSHLELTQQSGHQPAPIENFSMAVYSRPTSAEGMPPPEVRPSLVLARRSSFSNSNGSLNTIPRPIGSGVRRTTSHATLVGGRREVNGVSDHSPSVGNLRSTEENRKTATASHRQENQSLGRAVSELNLCAGFPLSPLEPELLKEFMEWRQQRQKDQEEKEKQQKVNPSPDLQSPQMLRNIMSQSQDDISGKIEAEREKENSNPVRASSNTSESTQKKETEKKSIEELPKPEVQEPVKRFVPPSIQLSTWSERPKRQVSIKSDRDYWVGVGAAALRPTQRSIDVVDSSDQKTLSHSQTISSTVEEQKNTAPTSGTTVQRLSRQYIVHTTPSGFRRPAEQTAVENGVVTAPSLGKPQLNKTSPPAEPKIAKSQKLVSSVSTGALPDRFERAREGLHHLSSLPETQSIEVPVTSKSDPSRVPIVRAVELKKTVSSDFRKPLIRQNATATSPNSSVVYFSSGPVATSSVTANGSSVNISSVKPSPPVKKFTSVVDISGPSNEKIVSGSSETQPLSTIKPSVHVNGFSSHSEPKKNLPMPVVKGFKLAQGVVNRQLSAPAATPAPPTPAPVPVPPPAPVMPVLKKVPRPSSLPPRVQDPRDQLLDAIRNFGGRTKLRPTT